MLSEGMFYIGFLVATDRGMGVCFQVLLGTRADHSRSGGVNQGNINSLAAVLGTDDLRQSLWSRLTQQFSCE